MIFKAKESAHLRWRYSNSPSFANDMVAAGWSGGQQTSSFKIESFAASEESTKACLGYCKLQAEACSWAPFGRLLLVLCVFGHVPGVSSFAGLVF
jgi:hypothetical protein